MNFKIKFSKGFTLIEVLIVVSIIGLLSSIVLVGLDGAKDQAEIGKAQEFSHVVRVTMGADLVGEWRFDNNAKAYLYIDGEFLGESASYGRVACDEAIATEMVNDMTLRYIGIGTHYNPHFVGTIDEVRIYNKALSLSEIRQLYAQGVKKHNIVLK